jgi:hypothetical protein
MRTLLAALAGATLLGTAAPAGAAVTIGSNLASPHADNMPGCNISCTATNAFLPVANRASGGLLSPVNGTVTSWRVRANAGLNLSLRVLRPADTAFTGMGTSAPASFPGPGLSPVFPTSLPIAIGDAVGLNSPNGNLVLAATPGAGQAFWNVPPLADGSTRVADAVGTGREVLVHATIEPTNTLTFGRVQRNKKKGVARLTVELPNPGTLEFSGNRLKIAQTAAATTVAAPGPVEFLLKAAGKKRKKLKRKGKTKVSPTFTFTPTHGVASTQSTTVGLKKKRKKRKK